MPLCFGMFDLPAPYQLDTKTDDANWLLGDNIGYILLFSSGAVAGPKTCSPSLELNEDMANKRLETSIMGQYWIRFPKGQEGLPAVWKKGRLMSIGLDEGEVAEWRKHLGEKLEGSKRSSRKRSVEVHGEVG